MGYGKTGLPKVKELVNFRLRQRNCGTGRLKPARIERLGYHSPVADVKQTAGGEKGVAGNFGGDELRCVIVEGSDVKAIVPGTGGATPIDEIEKMFAIR